MSSAPLYQLSQLTQAYKGRTVLNIDELIIHQGEILAIVGPSGAGKSTLLRLLAFLETPTSGHLTYQGHSVVDVRSNMVLCRQITMVFQQPHLLQQMSVYENIVLGLKLRGKPVHHYQEQLDLLVEQLGLSLFLNAAPHTLSGGEKQRVALARALILMPAVLLLDEPTANLDPYNINMIEYMIQQANKNQGTTVVIITHNIFQARRLSQRTGLLLNSQLIEIAPTDTFFNNPTHPKTTAFVQGDLVY